jgi:hypothetical protein
LGGGPRLHITDSEKLTVAFGSGLMYEDESWSFSEQDSATQFLKSTSYFAYHHELNKVLEVNLIGYYQARFDYYFDRPRIIGDANLNVEISEHFSFVSKFVILYDAAPVVPIDKLIYNFQNGIKIKF